MEQLKDLGPVSMVLLNDGDHAYTKYRLDSNTMARLFDVPITQIENNLLRSQIWHQITMSMLDQQVTSVKLFDYLAENLPYETTEQTIVDSIKTIDELIRFYLPLGRVEAAS